MLRISDYPPENSTSSFLSIDRKKRQVTLSESTSITNIPSTSPTLNASSTQERERGPMVAAPKMFAFDSLFTNEDTQVSPNIYLTCI